MFQKYIQSNHVSTNFTIVTFIFLFSFVICYSALINIRIVKRFQSDQKEVKNYAFIDGLF